MIPRRLGPRSAKPRTAKAGCAVVFLGLFLLAQPGCHTTSPPPNIILITIDTLRADHLSVYGDTTIHTPNIGRLAAEGILFENAFTNVTWTVPSLATVMTGEYPYEHGVRRWDDRLGTKVTLAATLRQHGYHTAAIVASAALDRVFGLDQGFEYYDDSIKTQDQLNRDTGQTSAGHILSQPEPPPLGSYLFDDKLADKAIAWIDHHPKGPFFLWVHFLGPHEKPERDNTGPNPTERAKAAYAPDVEFMDRQVGRFLQRIREDPIASQTAILFHSDHGQSLMEHGLMGHGQDLYDTTAHVPLIIRLPGKRDAGQRVNRVVANVDLFPTVLSLAGVPPPGTHGHDLLATDGKDETVYMETFLTADFPQDTTYEGKKLSFVYSLRGLRTRNWKLIETDPFPAPQPDGRDGPPLPVAFVDSHRAVALISMKEDPEERKSVATVFPKKTDEMLARLSTYASGDASGSHVDLDGATRERLRALGYLKR